MKRARVVLLSAAVCCSAADGQSWFQTGQNADLMLSGVDFNNAGGPLSFNHPSGIASDGTRFLLCDRFNNRILIWNSLPTRWDAPPDLVLGQQNFISNNPGNAKSELNFAGNVSVSTNGVIGVADTYNDRILIWKQFPTHNGQPAEISISLPALPSSGSQRYAWPWGVWTDGTKLVACATGSGALLFWNTLPTREDQPPDYTIALPELGTPRNISTDGSSYFFVGDHNAKVSGDRAGTFFWNSFPTQQNQPFSFYRDEWIKGTKLPDGTLVAGGLASVYIWNSVPTSASQQPILVLINPYYKNGDGPDVVFAGGRMYINNYNGNNVHVYNSIPTSTSQQPDFALGGPSPTVNTLDSINYIQNPVVATDGRSLLVSSDFDRMLWIWRSMPMASGQKPDIKISLAPFNIAPWDNALYDGKFAAAGRQELAIWDSIPLNGQPPSRIFRGGIGSARFQQLKGVALDGLYLYLADQSGTIYVWRGSPVSGNEAPFRVITVPSTPLNHLNSDGMYLCVAVQGNPPSVCIYRVADITNSATPAPWKIVNSTFSVRLNLPASALTFNGSLAIANTANNSVWLWRDINDAGDASKVVVLGQTSASSFSAAIGVNRLLMPASLAFFQNRLWVGEMKFSSRILRFTAGDVTSAPMAEPSSVKTFVLKQNYPNPFNPRTSIEFSLEKTCRATLKIFDLLGRQIAIIFDGEAEAGRLHRVHWDAARMPSGMYVAKLESNGKRMTRRLAVVK